MRKSFLKNYLVYIYDGNALIQTKQINYYLTGADTYHTGSLLIYQ